MIARPCALALAIFLAASIAVADPRLDWLASDDRTVVAAAVVEVEAATTTPELADALFAAARACEERLLDPSRALHLYQRLIRELPDARVSVAAERRAERLREIVGSGGEHAREGAAFAQLVAQADTLTTAVVIARAEELAATAWPGAGDVALWLAEYLRRVKRWSRAQRQYASVVERWPGSPRAVAALRGGAGNAIEAGDWALAEDLTARLPVDTPDDRVLRDDLDSAIASGRMRSRLYRASWAVVIGVVLLLVASLADASLRGGRRRPRLRPPVELWFLIPLAVLVVGVAYVARPAIAPTVRSIVVTGAALAYLSGVTIDLLRARGRPHRARSVLHAAAIGLAVLAAGYVSITRNELMELLVETIRSGPE